MSSSSQRLVVVDGNAVLHRAWHALPPLTTKGGVVVTGVYGFTMLLLRAIAQLKPSHVAVTFDLAGPTFRHKAFADYKATREKKPDELYAQIPLIERVLEAMRIPVFTAKGFEADDVIGTLSKISPIPTIIVTGDMDTLQLVNEKTSIFTLRKGLTDTVTYDIEGVRRKTGLSPEQMIDYKALRGDTSDNIPGVKGIGEKTATELLAQFGTLEALYAALDANDAQAAKLRPAVREKLLAGRADALQAKHLVTIVCDVPLKFALETCELQPTTRDMVRDIFEELQFTRLLQQLPEHAGDVVEAGVPVAPKAKKEKKVSDTSQGALNLDAAPREALPDVSVALDDKGALAECVAAAQKAGQLAFRSVSDLDVVQPVVQELLVAAGGKVWKAACAEGKLSSATSKALVALFADKKVAKVCFDAKIEYAACETLGLSVAGNVFDLMIASYVLHGGERRHELDALLAMYRTMRIGEDGDSTLADAVAAMPGIAEEMAAEMEKAECAKIFADIDMPLASVLRGMERKGVAIDEKWFSVFSRDLETKISALLADIYRHAGKEFNVNSPAQLQEVLFTTLGLSAKGMKKTAKSKSVSTAAAELEKLRDEHPIIGAVLDYREVAKLKSTYVDAIPKLVHPVTGRVHARFNQTVAATGRLSSSDPNLQNIPTPESEYGKRVRDGFISKKGFVLVAADYSQFELRVAAHLAQEPAMLQAFKNGEDIHARTAATMFGEEQAQSHRRVAKVINFGILYGMGPHRLAESAGISFAEAQHYIEQYFALLPNVQKYMDATVEKMKADGYVETLFGRRRYFRNYRLMDKREQAEAERQAVNMPIQGTQADIVKLAMLRVDEALAAAYGEGDDVPVRMLVQVHDELIFEVKKSEVDAMLKLVMPIMEGAWKLDVPIVVNASVGERWGSMTKVR
jgi:DNA polymerase-1